MTETTIPTERYITETEKAIRARKRSKSMEQDLVYSCDTITSTSIVGKTCGYRSSIVYRALLGSYRVQKQEWFKLLPVFEQATQLSKAQISQDIQKLERAGFIQVTRQEGHKNLYTLSKQGKKGIPKMQDFTVME